MTLIKLKNVEIFFAIEWKYNAVLEHKLFDLAVQYYFKKVFQESFNFRCILNTYNITRVNRCVCAMKMSES